MLSALLFAAAWIAPLGPPLHGRICRAASIRALAAPASGLDTLVQKLREAPADQLPALLSENIKGISSMGAQQLFMRLAELSDAAESDAERDEISALASTVATTLESLIAKAETALDADAADVQSVMALAADEAGEFAVPLPPAKRDAVRAAIREKGAGLGEGFVATARAYMDRASDDSLDGMVELLREVLQIYASEKLIVLTDGRIPDEAISTTLTAVLRSPASDWSSELRSRLLAADAAVEPVAFQSVLQDQMGEVVLGMPSGSNEQMVLAEFLNLLLSTTREVAAEA